MPLSVFNRYDKYGQNVKKYGPYMNKYMEYILIRNGQCHFTACLKSTKPRRGLTFFTACIKHLEIRFV